MTWPRTAHGTDACAEAHHPTSASSPTKTALTTLTMRSVLAVSLSGSDLVRAPATAKAVTVLVGCPPPLALVGANSVPLRFRW